MDENWITVPEAAERLGTSEEMVRRYIRQGRLFAKRSGRGVHSPWLVDAHQVAADAVSGEIKTRLARAGVVTGRGGTPEADAAFREDVRKVHGDDTADAAGVAMDRVALIEQAAAAVESQRAELWPQFHELDEAEQIELAAREIADRVLRAERIRQRVREIVEDDEQ